MVLSVYMRILYVITKSEPGGAQSAVSELIKAHVMRGDNVGLIVDKPGWLTEKAILSGVKVFYNASFSNSVNPFTHIDALTKTYRAIKTFLPDVISTHSFAGGVQGRLASLGSSVKRVHTLHGVSFTSGTPLWRKVVALLWEGVLGLYTHSIVTVSLNDARLTSLYLPFLKKKIITIHNGVDVSLRSVTFENTPPYTLIYVARMAIPKTPWRLIEAMKGLPVEIQSQFNIVFVGDGPYLWNLKSEAKIHIPHVKVEYTGMLPREEIRDKMLSSHAFIFTSQWEGFPMVILEALACGLPVFASNVGGVSEVVDETVGALLDVKDEVGSLRTHLERITTQSLILSHMSVAAKEKIKTHFTGDMMTKKTLNTIDMLLKK